MIGQCLFNIYSKCIKRNVLHKFHAYPTFHSRVIRFFEAGGLVGTSGVDGRVSEQSFNLECKKPLMS